MQKISVHRRTELIFGDDRFIGDERFALSEIVDSRHAKLVLFTVVETGDVEARRPAEPAHWTPDSALFVLLLHDVVAYRPTAVVLRRK